MVPSYVAYYRVSTQKQGQSGLGLTAQKRTVEDFCRKGVILAEFTDIESGKNNQRPELAKAIAYAKTHSAMLIIAKLDRLSRNVHFISSLMESKVHFKACDMPEADHFTVHLFAALAEKERRMISERTKAALQSKKEQGYKLGSPANLTHQARQISIFVKKREAATNADNTKNASIARFLKEQKKGPKGKKWSLRDIAAELNRMGFSTREGKIFHASTVSRLLKTFKDAPLPESKNESF